MKKTHKKSKISFSKAGSKRPIIYLDNQVVKVRDAIFHRKIAKQSRSNFYYLDNAASTPISSEVKKEMAEAAELYGNPSSFNDAGRGARKKLENSRLAIARFLGAHPEEIIFTSSGSEANNMALLGLADTYLNPGEIITTPIEHPSVLEPLKVLQKRGWTIRYLKIDKEGRVNLDDFKSKLNPRTKIVSIMYANNEIGTIQPIKEIAKIIRNFRNRKFEINENIYPAFHVDACQATEYLNMNIYGLGVDLLVLNGTKIYGPRGAAVLYKRREVPLSPIIHGGDQEWGLRAGTENLMAIAGLAKAISLISKEEGKRVTKLRDYFIGELKKGIPDVNINGPLGDSRLPNNVNISIPSISGENLLLELDKYGIYASSGSACTARSVEPSHVLKAIGVEDKYLGGALRFSLGRQTTKKHLDYVSKVLPRIVGDLRKRYK